jgi:hypothetical protein
MRSRLTRSLATVLLLGLGVFGGCGREDRRLTEDRQSCAEMGHPIGTPQFQQCMQDLNERRCAVVPLGRNMRRRRIALDSTHNEFGRLQTQARLPPFRRSRLLFRDGCHDKLDFPFFQDKNLRHGWGLRCPVPLTFIKAYGSVIEARRGIGGWLCFYNEERPHQELGCRTPCAVFAGAACEHVILGKGSIDVLLSLE